MQHLLKSLLLFWVMKLLKLTHFLLFTNIRFHILIQRSRITFKQDRFTAPFKRTLTMINKMFGDIWPNVAVVVNFWDAGDDHTDKTKEIYTQELQKTFK